MSIKLADLIAEIPVEAEGRIKRVLEQTRPLVQEALRAECRLNLRTSDEALLGRSGARIPIKLVAGCPDALSDVEFPPEYELALLIAPFRAGLGRTISGATELIGLQGALALRSLSNSSLPSN